MATGGELFEVRVDGRVFTVTSATLNKSPYFQARLVRWSGTDRVIMIDTDPYSFAFVLDVLRYGCNVENHDTDGLTDELKNRIRHDLDYIGIVISDELANALKAGHLVCVRWETSESSEKTQCTICANSQ